MKATAEKSGPVFEVIQGGLPFQDDIPAPDKPIEEWTPEEREEYERRIWETAQSGTLEHVMKTMEMSEEALYALINSLEAIRAALIAEAEAEGLRDEWQYVDGEYLLQVLKNRQQFGTGSASD